MNLYRYRIMNLPACPTPRGGFRFTVVGPLEIVTVWAFARDR